MEILNLNRSAFLSSLQPSLDNVDSVDSGHGTSAASSAGGGGGIIVAHPADRSSAAADCPAALDKASDISLAAHSSYVKIPPIDAFLASLSATTVSVSPPAATDPALAAAECGSLSSPTFATFHPGGRASGGSGGRSGGSPNNNGREKSFSAFIFSPP